MLIIKIAVRGGHNFSVPGAKGIIDETTEDRKVYSSVIKYLKLNGDEVIDVTSSIVNVGQELAEGISKANNAKVDLFVSIHFNKAYDAYKGALGSEVWLNPANTVVKAAGIRILSNLASVGFKNRGIQDGVNKEHLYEVRNTTMLGMIVEVCFTETTEDVKIYQSIGSDAIGKLIAEGIVGQEIIAPKPTPNPAPQPSIGATVKIQQHNLNRLLNFNIAEDGINGPITQNAIKIFQTAAGLKVDGIAGSITESAINSILAKPLSSINKKPSVIVIKFIQYRTGTKNDGFWGTGTDATVKGWQGKNGLQTDGILGTNSWNKLIGKGTG